MFRIRLVVTSSTPDGAGRFTVIAELLNGDPRPCFQRCPAQSLFLAVSFEVFRLKHSIIRVNGFLAWAHDSHSRYYFRCPHLPILTKPQGRCKRLDRVEGGDDFSRSHKNGILVYVSIAITRPPIDHTSDLCDCNVDAVRFHNPESAAIRPCIPGTA